VGWRVVGEGKDSSQRSGRWPSWEKRSVGSGGEWMKEWGKFDVAADKNDFKT
jgi:hypothetical protein